MGRKPKIQTRVERDTKEAIDAYTDDNGELTQSEAVRHLIRAGLAQKGYPVAAADGSGGYQETAMQWADRSLYGTVLLAILTVGLGLSTNISTTPDVFTAFVIAGIGTGTAALTGLLSLGAWFALELHTDSDVTTTTEDAA